MSGERFGLNFEDVDYIFIDDKQTGDIYPVVNSKMKKKYLLDIIKLLNKQDKIIMDLRKDNDRLSENYATLRKICGW